MQLLFIYRKSHTFWHLPRRTQPAESVHGDASHRDTGSQSPEVDRNVYCHKAHSRHVHVPLLTLKKGEDESVLICDKTGIVGEDKQL